MTETEGQYILSANEFGKCFLEYRVPFIRKAFRYVRNEEVATDIVSESFMVFWEKKDALPPDTNVPAYIFTIIRNKCLNYLRDQAAHLQKEEKLHSIQSDLIEIDIASLTACDPNMLFRTEIFDILRDTLDKLPPRTREVFLMSRFENKNYKEIAEELGISFFSVHHEMRNSLRELRIALKDYLMIIIVLIFCAIG